MMILVECPECKSKVDDKAHICEKCGFDLLLYKEAYENIYNKKIQDLNRLATVNSSAIKPTQSKIENKTVHNPRCPYCNSENLTRITSVDKVINIAVFGIFGNKRKYQWHCNNCKTNW